MDNSLGLVSWLKPRSLEFKFIGIPTEVIFRTRFIASRCSSLRKREKSCKGCVCVFLLLIVPSVNTEFWPKARHSARPCVFEVEQKPWVLCGKQKSSQPLPSWSLQSRRNIASNQMVTETNEKIAAVVYVVCAVKESNSMDPMILW